MKETKQGTKRKQNIKKRRKKEKNERERERERERDRERESESEEGGGKKRLRKNKGRHSELGKNAFLGGKVGFAREEQEKRGKKQKKLRRRV